MPHPLHVVSHGVIHLGFVHHAHLVLTVIVVVAVHIGEADTLSLLTPVPLVAVQALLVSVAILASK